MKHAYVFGELPGHPVGTVYPGRREAMWAGLHATSQPGISGIPEEGADCIALNQGYVDDEDHGDWILYTGAGGNDSNTKRQVANQDIHHRHNAALVYSEESGLPIRVLRGPNVEKPYAPARGYRYDGLYKIVRHWADTGRDGFLVWRFRLERLTLDEAEPWTPDGQTPASGPVADYTGPVETITLKLDDEGKTRNVTFSRPVLGLGGHSGRPPAVANRPGVNPPKPQGNPKPGRATGVVQRIVRNNDVSQWVKTLYRDCCQICRVQLDLPVGRYSEGAHIRAVGQPHNGPDTVDNMLCLCPNDHVKFDKGAIYIDDDLTVRDHTRKNLGRLATEPEHQIDLDHIAYHREHHGFGV